MIIIIIPITEQNTKLINIYYASMINPYINIQHKTNNIDRPRLYISTGV